MGARSTTLLECGPLGNRLRKMVLDFDVPRSELPPDTTQPDALHKEVVQFARYLQPPLWLPPLAPPLGSSLDTLTPHSFVGAAAAWALRSATSSM